MEHKLPRPGPLWRIPCQQDLQFVAAELVQVEGTLIFSVLALEVLNWLRHVNPKSVLSLPRINSASNSFGEYTVGDCVRLSLRHIRTRCEGKSQAAQPKADLSLSFSADPGTLMRKRAFSLFKHFHTFCMLHRTPGDEEGIDSGIVPLLDRVCSCPCYAFLAEKL